MTTIQIRDVPPEVSRALKAKAAAEGRSLSAYLLAEVERLARRPSRAELLARLAEREPVDLPAAETVLAEARSGRPGR